MKKNQKKKISRHCPFKCNSLVTPFLKLSERTWSVVYSTMIALWCSSRCWIAAKHVYHMWLDSKWSHTHYSPVTTAVNILCDWSVGVCMFLNVMGQLVCVPDWTKWSYRLYELIELKLACTRIGEHLMWLVTELIVIEFDCSVSECTSMWLVKTHWLLDELRLACRRASHAIGHWVERNLIWLVSGWVYANVIGENTDRLMDLNSLSVSILAWDQSSSYTAFSTSS